MDRRPSKDFWLTVASASLMLALIWAAVWRIDGSERERYLQDQRAAVQSKVGGIRAELEKNLNQRLHLVRGLAAFARSQPHIDRQAFDVYARELQGSQTGIMSLQLAPGGVITYIHPLAGNEGAQGHDLLRDERARPIVLEMLETREFRLAGPMTLRQGGIGLIGRMPVYTTTAAGAAAAFRDGERVSEHQRGMASAMAPQAGRTGLSSPVPPPSRVQGDTGGGTFMGFCHGLDQLDRFAARYRPGRRRGRCRVGAARQGWQGRAGRGDCRRCGAVWPRAARRRAVRS